MIANMSEITRRDVLVGGAAIVATGGRLRAQETVTQDKATGDLAGGPKVFAMGSVATTKAANGNTRKGVLKGKLPTGEAVSMHESWSPAGATVTPHKILHSELVVVMEGTLEYEHEGKFEKAEAGDVVYVPYGTTHALRSAGPGEVRFMVVAVGGDVG
jgi:quercetin dioxygenase-like cupin family protein